MSVSSQFLTHELENQPLPLAAYDAWGTDAALREAVEREGGGWADAHLGEFGKLAGGELMELGYAANENRPKLRSFDRYGRRLDDVDFHPAYHEIMRLSMRFGVHSFAWRNTNRPGAHVARAALAYMAGQADSGTGCPLTMTYASVPVLRHAPDLAKNWLPKVTSLNYDPRSVPAGEKAGCTVGMGMTEKQGGSDVRANTTKALRQPDGTHAIVGHKYFFSAPMCDAHLVLAQAEGGLSCFLVPRILPDGSRNAVRIQRLKDKLGDWSNASSEVEFAGATGFLAGDEGRGIATIIEMVALTRLDCMTGSAGLMRQAVIQALNHTRQRRAFGKLLTDQPVMQNVLADLVLESEAAIALTMRVARAVDGAAASEAEASFARIATAIGKYWICKRAPAHVNEAQECLGGIGYVEEANLARLYRQAPLNSIWEGSGNVQCLDVLRALNKDPEVADALFSELRSAKGLHAGLDREVAWIEAALADRENIERRSRLLVEKAALALQGSILLRSGNEAVARSFCDSRLSGEHGLVFGTLSPDVPAKALIERAMVEA